MPKPATTIYSIAAEASVSPATVSRVLNGSSNVNQETRTRVMEVINRLEFVPKAEARARALRRNYRIGILVPFFTAPSFVQRLRGVAAALSTNYELVIYTVNSTDQLDGYLASLPLTGNLDGLIIMSLAINEAQAQHLSKNQLETVLIEYPQTGFSTVEIDDVYGGKMAAEYLAQKGHRRIAFLGDTNLPEYAIHPISQRLVGFRQKLLELGIPLPDDYVRLASYSLEQARQVAAEFLNLSVPPSAIFAATDLQAMGVIMVARQMGLNIPADLAVMGFDNLDMAELMELTTIQQPLDDSGRVAVELLLGRITTPSRSLQHVQLPLTIVERKTV
ncbi:MAG: LacI family DNA-binding transcriptional regulator [Aggregatilineales bacterium]